MQDDDRESPGGPSAAAPAAVDAATEVVGPASHIAEVSSKLSLIGHQIRAATQSQGARMEEMREAIADVTRGARDAGGSCR